MELNRHGKKGRLKRYSKGDRRLKGFIVTCTVATVGETSEALGVRTQRDTRRAGALMANTGGLFGASAGEFTRHVTGPRSDHTDEMPPSILKSPPVAPGFN